MVNCAECGKEFQPIEARIIVNNNSYHYFCYKIKVWKPTGVKK
jgi:hypothetical protein